jgi:hypothetical protein
VWPCTDRFLRALAGPHEVTVRGELWRRAQHGGTWRDELAAPLAITGGEVTLDAQAAIWAHAEITAQSAAPDLARVLAEPGIMLRLWRGIRYPGGLAEEIPLGRHVITAHERAAQDTEVSITAESYQRWIADDRFHTLDVSGLAWRDVMIKLITERMPAPIRGAVTWDVEEWNKLSGTRRARAGTVLDGVTKNPAEHLAEIAAGFGVLAWPGRDGTWRFTPAEPPPGTGPAWSCPAGPGGVQIAARAGLRRDKTSNVIIARGEEITGDDGKPRPVPQAEAAITQATHPGSPLDSNGMFGRKVRFYASPLITTDDQALQSARTLLERYGTADTWIETETIVNPALDPLDVIETTAPDGTRTRYQVSEVSIPLTLDGTLTLAARQQPGEDEEGSR